MFAICSFRSLTLASSVMMLIGSICTAAHAVSIQFGIGGQQLQVPDPCSHSRLRLTLEGKPGIQPRAL